MSRRDHGGEQSPTPCSCTHIVRHTHTLHSLAAWAAHLARMEPSPVPSTFSSLFSCVLRTCTCTIALHKQQRSVASTHRLNAIVPCDITWVMQGHAHVCPRCLAVIDVLVIDINEQRSARESVPRCNTCEHSLACACARAHTAPSALRYILPVISCTRRQAGCHHPLTAHMLCAVHCGLRCRAASACGAQHVPQRAGADRSGGRGARISGSPRTWVLSLPYSPLIYG